MPWSAGVYTRGYPSWTNDANSNLPISATKFDTEDNDFAAGLNNCVTKDGLNKPTAGMDWNNQNLINVLSLTTGNWNVTGATIPANGMYLPAANTVGWATNSIARGSINSAGSWILPAATAAITFDVTGASAQVVIAVRGAGSDAVRLGLVDGNTGNRFYQIRVGGSATGVFDVFDATAGASRFAITAAGLVQAVDQGGTFQDVGWRDCPQNIQTANYTLALSDRGKQVFMNAAGITLTIPANASIAFPVGTTILVCVGGLGSISVAITTDTLFLAGVGTTGTRTVVAFGLATLTKIASNQWFIGGTGVS